MKTPISWHVGNERDRSLATVIFQKATETDQDLNLRQGFVPVGVLVPGLFHQDDPDQEKVVPNQSHLRAEGVPGQDLQAQGIVVGQDHHHQVPEVVADQGQDLYLQQNFDGVGLALALSPRIGTDTLILAE